MNTPIFIEYETKSREFDGKLLLVSNLLNGGYKNIFLGTNRYLRQLALRNHSGIYFLKSISINDISFYTGLKNQNHKLVLLHAEGGIHYKDNENSIRTIFNPQVSCYLDFNFLFGELIKDSITKYDLDKINIQLCVSGDPRFDLLKEKFDTFFRNDINRLQSQFGDFILINTSFSASNPEMGLDKLRKYWQNEPTFTDSTVDALMFKIDYFSSIVDSYLVAIKVLATTFPDKNFIVRPHPSESMKIYIEHFGSYENIHVTKENNVALWIKASKGVMHYDCTTGIEAHIAGKPVIAFVPQIDERVVAWLPVAISKNIATVDNLISQMDLIFSNKFVHHIDPNISKALNRTVHNTSFESSPIITGLLRNSIRSSNNNIVEKSKPISEFFNQVKYDFRITAKKIIYKILNKSDSGFSKRGKFTKKEVRTKLVTLNIIQGFRYNFKLKMLTQDCIRITKIEEGYKHQKRW